MATARSRSNCPIREIIENSTPVHLRGRVTRLETSMTPVCQKYSSRERIDEFIFYLFVIKQMSVPRFFVSLVYSVLMFIWDQMFVSQRPTGSTPGVFQCSHKQPSTNSRYICSPWLALWSLSINPTFHFLILKEKEHLIRINNSPNQPLK